MVDQSAGNEVIGGPKKSRSKLYIPIVIVIVILSFALGFVLYSHHKASTSTSNRVVTGRAIQVTVDVKDNKPVSGPFTYIVRQGDRLQFTINTDTLGTIGVPSSPPEKIKVTSNSVVFTIAASAKGDFSLTYQPPGNTNTAVIIGTIRVK